MKKSNQTNNCPKCGKEVSANIKFCGYCGEKIDNEVKQEKINMSEESSFKQDTESQQTVIKEDKKIKKNSGKSKSIIKKWYFWAIAVLAIAVIVFLSVFIINQLGNNGGGAPVAFDIMTPEHEYEGKTLSAGTYNIGDDLPAGKYTLMYKTSLDEKKYWANDYLYITRNGSEGSQETLGGTKYDERFGDVMFKDASEGKSFFVNLKSGDKIVVNSKYGTWTY